MLGKLRTEITTKNMGFNYGEDDGTDAYNQFQHNFIYSLNAYKNSERIVLFDGEKSETV
ncbi:MAG: hypothetical protein KA715_05220 [Xanthomonadaceae bacterium]|nr:hypothetical protein [Xanthomonadaceae bacterium]